MSGPQNEIVGDEVMNVRVMVHNSCEHLDGLVSATPVLLCILTCVLVGSTERRHWKCGV